MPAAAIGPVGSALVGVPGAPPPDPEVPLSKEERLTQRMQAQSTMGNNMPAAGCYLRYGSIF